MGSCCRARLSWSRVAPTPRPPNGQSPASRGDAMQQCAWRIGLHGSIDRAHWSVEAITKSAPHVGVWAPTAGAREGRRQCVARNAEPPPEAPEPAGPGCPLIGAWGQSERACRHRANAPSTVSSCNLVKRVHAGWAENAKRCEPWLSAGANQSGPPLIHLGSTYCPQRNPRLRRWQCIHWWT